MTVRVHLLLREAPRELLAGAVVPAVVVLPVAGLAGWLAVISTYS